MTVKYSLDLKKKLINERPRACISCGLYLNQLPLLDEGRECDVFWVGLSAIKVNSEDKGVPLAAHTRTGSLLHKIEKPLLGKVGFYKTNLIKCLPLQSDKIRYPKVSEMHKCYPNLQYEMEVLKPKIVILLGQLVSGYMRNLHDQPKSKLDENFKYEFYKDDGVYYVPIHHPSYILVYKHKKISNYCNEVLKIIKKLK